MLPCLLQAGANRGAEVLCPGNDLPLVGAQLVQVGCGFPERASLMPTLVLTPQCHTLALLLQGHSAPSSSGFLGSVASIPLVSNCPNSSPAAGTQRLWRYTVAVTAQIIQPSGPECRHWRMGTEALPRGHQGRRGPGRCRMLHRKVPNDAKGAHKPCRRNRSSQG